MIVSLPENRLASPSLFPCCLTLKAVRIAQGWSERYVSDRSGINRGYLHQFETGKCKPWPAAIAKLCALFELGALDLFPELESSKHYCGPMYPPCLTLKKARQERGLTQHGLAIAANVSADHISKFERGERKPWDSAILKLCETLELTELSLFPEIQAIKESRKERPQKMRIPLRERVLVRKVAKGEDSGTAKLTEIEVLEIRWLHLHRRLTYKKLSEMFRVSQTTIEYVVMGKNWKHIPDELV